MLVVAIMASTVLAGGLIPVTGRIALSQASWLLPARWGLAASASTVDLRHLEVDVPPTGCGCIRRYSVLDMGMLAALGLAATVFARFRLRLPARGHARYALAPRQVN